MARGWESKSVESQIEDANLVPVREKPSTAEQRELGLKRSSIELSRTRVLRELDQTQSPLRRTALQNALTFLDAEISKLDASK